MCLVPVVRQSFRDEMLKSFKEYMEESAAAAESGDRSRIKSAMAGQAKGQSTTQERESGECALLSPHLPTRASLCCCVVLFRIPRRVPVRVQPSSEGVWQPGEHRGEDDQGTAASAQVQGNAQGDGSDTGRNTRGTGSASFAPHPICSLLVLVCCVESEVDRTLAACQSGLKTMIKKLTANYEGAVGHKSKKGHNTHRQQRGERTRAKTGRSSDAFVRVCSSLVIVHPPSALVPPPSDPSRSPHVQPASHSPHSSL